IFEAALVYEPEAGTTVRDIEERYRNIERQMISGDGSGGAMDGIARSLPGAAKALEEAREGAVKAQQAANYSQLREIDAAYRDLGNKYEAAVKEGDASGIQRLYTGMTALYNRGSALKREALGGRSAEYNSENRADIQMMFTTPPLSPQSRAKKTPAEKKLTSEQLIDNLVQQFINGFNPAEFSTDSTGQLTGFYVTDPATGESTYYTGLSLNAIYQELNKYAEESGDEHAPGQLSYEFRKKLLTRMADQAETSEAKRTFSQLISFTESQWEKIKKKTGMEKAAIEETMMSQVLDAFARYSNSQDPSPQKNAVLEQALKGIRDQYIGKALYFLYDDNKTSETTNTRGFLGSLNKVGKALDAYHKNPAINLPGASGGRNIPPHLDDNFRSFTNQAEALAREELGATKTAVEGGDVIVTDKNGGRYRIGGSSGGDIYLYKPDGSGGWIPIAKRQYPGEDKHTWIKTDMNGEMKRAPRSSTLRGRREAAYELFEGL
ncbi:MAG: hypothetical protein LBF74_03695, partial [Treponema sp.]|nr:hypothetical protein [Treponema sp.]